MVIQHINVNCKANSYSNISLVCCGGSEEHYTHSAHIYIAFFT